MIEKLLNYKKLKTREKVFIIMLISVIAINSFYHFLYKPLKNNINTYKFQIQKLESRVDEIRVKFPPIDKQRQNMISLQAEWDNLLTEIIKVEKTLPDRKNTPQLIGELTRLAKGFKVSSIRRKIDEGADYSRLFVELKFNAPYQEIVDYIKGIETISPFLKIEDLEISEPQGKDKKDPAGTPVRMVLTILLGEIPFSDLIQAKEIEASSSEMRDIFVSKLAPISSIRKSKLKLDGITYDPQFPTAIINGEVARAGAQIGEFKVKEILPDKVIVIDGVEEHILYVEREL